MRGVSRSYGGAAAPALSELSLSLDRGEFVTLLGPSGCGKSTALACIAGLQPLSGGSIWRDGTRVDRLPAHRRGFGMVFQSYALFPHLSVQRNVEFGLSMRGVHKAEREKRAIDALKLVQLSDHAQKLPSQLSGGQQQRVAIARALAIEPEIVLMDEPLSNLDAALRIEMRTEIKRLYQERGLSVIYVTHDQEEALSLATRMAVLRHGRLEQTGTPEELYARPASPYVAGFMGYRNLFPARVVGSAGEGLVKVAASVIELIGVTDAETLRSGDAVTVAIRPEDVEIADTPSAPNAIGALAEVVEYHGREVAVRAVVDGGFAIDLKTSKRVAAGDRVRLTVPPERVLVFPADSSAAPTEEELDDDGK
ncbi:ABC transporter ATP-binding protein [Gryllotalpicola protaetiae]|uniref:ABC transporter ATP-binding protein n=2 Tax=Gryllotalpicola protaetiae TaxID=2419771 RepID=A0A387BMC8_9MICO|nr:ABC transporter ATP-binding protein [Gryllotalpicola protaetiae]